jgi:hypothetical protein
MGSEISGSAAVVVAQLSADHESGRGPIPGLVREKARAAPELAEVIV